MSESLDPIARRPATRLHVLPGPPGHEHIPHLPSPPPEIDIRRRRARPVPPAVRKGARLVAEALFTPDGEPVDAERLDWLENDFADFYSRAHGNARLVLRASIFALTWIAPLFAFVPAPLGALSLRRRVIALERFESSPLSPAALAVKAMLCLMWFEHPRTRAETGTEPSCLGDRA